MKTNECLAVEKEGIQTEKTFLESQFALLIYDVSYFISISFIVHTWGYTRVQTVILDLSSTIMLTNNKLVYCRSLKRPAIG